MDHVPPTDNSSALKIVSERSTKGQTRDLLLEDLSSSNRAVRTRALNALHFLLSNRTINRSTMSSRLQDVTTFTALVNCLCNLLKEHTTERGTTLSQVLPRTRPLGESKALSTLNLIMPENLPAALEAGVVSRWLSNYPFPCAKHDEAKKRDVFVLIKRYWQDDPLMYSIMNTISSQQDGLKQLRKYGLMGSRLEELSQDEHGVPDNMIVDDEDEDGSEYDEDDDSDVWMVDGEDTAGVPLPSTRRQQEATAEEQAIRRRRREAMVFNEGGRPLRQDDIIQPVYDDGAEEDLEDEGQPPRVVGEMESEESQMENPVRRNRRSIFSWSFGD